MHRSHNLNTSEMYTYAAIPENLPWPNRVCCSGMLRYRTLNADCVQHGYNCPGRPISCHNDNYHIRSPNGDYRIEYCPWCGAHLNNEIKYPQKSVEKTSRNYFAMSALVLYQKSCVKHVVNVKYVHQTLASLNISG